MLKTDSGVLLPACSERMVAKWFPQKGVHFLTGWEKNDFTSSLIGRHT